MRIEEESYQWEWYHQLTMSQLQSSHIWKQVWISGLSEQWSGWSHCFSIGNHLTSNTHPEVVDDRLVKTSLELGPILGEKD